MGLHFCLLLSHIFYYLSKGKIHIILIKPTSYPTDIKENTELTLCMKAFHSGCWLAQEGFEAAVPDAGQPPRM